MKNLINEHLDPSSSDNESNNELAMNLRVNLKM